MKRRTHFSIALFVSFVCNQQRPTQDTLSLMAGPKDRFIINSHMSKPMHFQRADGLGSDGFQELFQIRL